MKNNEFYKFLISLAKDLNKFYKKNLNKPFKAFNKGKGSNYDPVTMADKKFEKFIRSKINKKYPSHSIVGEEFGKKTNKDLFIMGINHAEFRNNQIIREWVLFDEVAIWKQILLNHG